MKNSVCAFVQARMSSRRYPGKVLAPFRGQPIIRHVLNSIEKVLSSSQIVVVTSTEESDNPLALYLQASHVPVFRGPLNNVFERFQQCLKKHPCDWILRICADSPLLDPLILQKLLNYTESDYDLVTTTFPRTFPRGKNAELIRVHTFLSLNSQKLTESEQEHPTSFFYRNSDSFKILNIESGDEKLSEINLSVDTVEDLLRLEK